VTQPNGTQKVMKPQNILRMLATQAEKVAKENIPNGVNWDIQGVLHEFYELVKNGKVSHIVAESPLRYFIRNTMNNTIYDPTDFHKRILDSINTAKQFHNHMGRYYKDEELIRNHASFFCKM
jgi:poly(3-hydroxyalkanoate) synthetase